MTFTTWRNALPVAALLAAAATPAAAQRPPSPEQQIVILQQQLAASQASAQSLSQRLNAVERQLQQLINLEEQNGHRIGSVESNLTELQNSQTSRIDALEQKVANLAAAPAPQMSETSEEPAPSKPVVTSTKPKPKPQSTSVSTAKSTTTTKAGEVSGDERTLAPVSDPGEDAYSQGFHLWQAGDYNGAIKSLRSFVSDYPNHPRTSFARNLIGRALLDAGQPRAAATELLANYRADPGGARAQDSLYYLGQSLMKIGQPGQACKAYGELESVYGSKVRPEIKELVAKGKANAGCR